MSLGLNHLTIAASDIQQSLNFYIDILGFHGPTQRETGTYLYQFLPILKHESNLLAPLMQPAHQPDYKKVLVQAPAHQRY